MYEINRRMIEREIDRSLFDASRFFVFKFNTNGYAIIKALAAGRFPQARFVALCAAREMTRESTEAFWGKCIAHRIVVESTE